MVIDYHAAAILGSVHSERHLSGWCGAMSSMADKNYLLSKYLPVVCADGTRTVMAPCDLLPDEGGRIPVSFAFADNLLNAVALEMVAGFLQAFAPPATEAEWARTWASPSPRDRLLAAFDAGVHHFEFRGAHPAFQDTRLVDAEIRPLARLFHTVPGGESFAISEEAAMVALYAMQAHAFGGGRGYRTSLAGGGPLRTVPVADETAAGKATSLFHRAWALVLTERDFRELGADNNATAAVYPWTGAPKAADVIGRASHPATTLYWGVPRRFLLPETTARGFCPITGQEDVALIEGVREKDGGPSYPSELWTHPLTPYVKDGTKGTLSPIRAVGFPDGIGWRHRAGLVADAGSEGCAARIVRVWAMRSRRLGFRHIRLHAYGARCDNAKVLGYLDSVQPYRLAPEANEAEVEAEMRNAARAAEEARKGLRSHLGETLRRDPSRDDWKAMGDVLDEAASSYWALTEKAADALFDTASGEAPGEDWTGLNKAREDFAFALRRAAVEVFDRMTESSRDHDPVHVAARRDSLHGIPYWPSVRTALALALPEVKAEGKAKRGGTKRGGKEKRQ